MPKNSHLWPLAAPAAPTKLNKAENVLNIAGHMQGLMLGPFNPLKMSPRDVKSAPKQTFLGQQWTFLAFLTPLVTIFGG